MLFVSTIIMKKNNISFKTKNKKLLILRTIIGTLGVAAYFYGSTKLPLVQVSLIEQLSPVSVMFASIIFLKEEVKKENFLFVIFTLTGAIIAIKPTSVNFNVYSLFILIDVIMTGLLMVVLRQLMTHGENEDRIVFYYAIYSLIFMLPLVFIYGFNPGGFFNLIILVLIGICFTFKQIIRALAVKYLEANQAGIFRYLEIFFAIIFGLVFFKEYPDIYSIIGSMIIILGIFIDYEFETKIHKKVTHVNKTIK